LLLILRFEPLSYSCPAQSLTIILNFIHKQHVQHCSTNTMRNIIG
jgi:hypothetical protein